MDMQSFIEKISKIKSNATFLTLSQYKNAAGEVADYSLVFNTSYESALERSIKMLQYKKCSSDLEEKAKANLISSFQNSLVKLKENTSCNDKHYKYFYNVNGKLIKGIKYHIASNTLHLYGSVVHKKVLVEGTYKNVNSGQLTIAKNKLKHSCPIGAYRQFKLTPEQVERIAVQKIELSPPQ